MTDIYEEVTNKIVKQLEKGVKPWSRSWDGGASFAMPQNATTGNAYNGINVLLLWGSAEENAFDTQDWGSYLQWQQQKKQVKKGAKGSPIVFYKTLEKEEDDKVKTIPLIRHSFVFNACQLEGYIPKEKEDKPLIERLENVDNYIMNTGAKIFHDGGNRAFYNRMSDDIHLPQREAFKDTESLYSVTLHELVHYTGAPHRLNRTKGKKFGDKDYAYEELVAELGAAFGCAKLEICNEPREDHAAYMENWLEVLKGDKRAIFLAASEASKAVEYMDQLQGAKVIQMTAGMRG